MNCRCLNIALSGINLDICTELKKELRQILPNHYEINWTNIANQNIDLLIISESLFDTKGIQSLINTNHMLCLKITTNERLACSLENNTLFFPFKQLETFENWIRIKLLSSLPASQMKTSFESEDLEVHSTYRPKLDQFFIKKMLKHENVILRLFDDYGTFAFLDTFSSLAWSDPTHTKKGTNLSLNYELAFEQSSKITAGLIKYELNNWLWNIFWQSHDFKYLAPEDDEYYKIDYWPQPIESSDQKMILLISACFIQGAQVSLVAKHLVIPVHTVQRYISACILVGNGSLIESSDALYKKNATVQSTEQQGFLNKFFGKIRRRFGI